MDLRLESWLYSSCLSVYVYRGSGKGNTVSGVELVITLLSGVGAEKCTSVWLNSGLVFLGAVERVTQSVGDW